MKKVLGICFILLVVFALSHKKQAEKAVDYVTAEGTPERVSESIIRDVWGALCHRSATDETVQRVESIKTVPQANGTLALDMRVRLGGATEHGVLSGLLDHVRKLFPKLLAEEKLNGYNEFRIYGSLPMVDNHGNGEEMGISKVFFTRSAAQKIQFDKIDYSELHGLLTKISDGKNCTYWVHGGILSKISWLKYFE